MKPAVVLFLLKLYWWMRSNRSDVPKRSTVTHTISWRTERSAALCGLKVSLWADTNENVCPENKERRTGYSRLVPAIHEGRCAIHVKRLRISMRTLHETLRTVKVKSWSQTFSATFTTARSFQRGNAPVLTVSIMKKIHDSGSCVIFRNVGQFQPYLQGNIPAYIHLHTCRPGIQKSQHVEFSSLTAISF
jgi:hypothetical protein